MKGFKQFIYSEIRHLFLDSPIPLRITQPVDGRFQTKTEQVEGFDMKFEFYTDANKLLHGKWIQLLPDNVRTHPGQVLINEAYMSPPGGKFYLTEVEPRLLQEAVHNKKAYVDVKHQTLIPEMGDPKTVIECEVNPLDRFHIPVEAVVDKKHGISVVRPGWEQKKVFDWWDFVECTGGSGYAKRSCHLDPYEIGNLLKEKGIE
jgi:hypothetical protein